MKRATIKDIAIKAGVNVSTVSRALKNHPDIGLNLRNKIKQLAEELHYHPNLAAVQLRKQKSQTIGLIIPEAHMFFFPSLIKGISETVQKLGYKLLVLQSGESYEQEVENIQICYEYGVDGLLISLTNKTLSLEHLEDLKEAGLPIVLIDKVLDNADFDEVLIDDVEATALCINHLIDTGCKRILGIFGNPNLMITLKRLEGFIKTIEKNAPHIESAYQFADSTFSAWSYIEQNFAAFKPDGIFAMSDELIAGVLPALRRLNINIPADCSVIGISDGYLPQILDPQVTFLHHDGFRLGKMAAQHLITTITGESNGKLHEKLLLPTSLVIKNSTKTLSQTII